MTKKVKNPVAFIDAIDKAVTKVRTRALDVSFNELYDMHKSAELTISPDFQRLFRWSEVKQSQFIESLILELPLPPIYVIEIEDSIYELIDGLQRISSYLHFRGHLAREDKIEDHYLELEGCDIIPELNGLTYNDLPTVYQIRLKRHFIRMEVVRRESDPRLRYHMFKRLNRGGALLSDQEIRNCTIRLLDSAFNEFLKLISKSDDYLACMKQLTEAKREQMYLEEYALRFFAMKNFLEKYEKNIGEFLTVYMESVSDPAKLDVNFDFEQEKLVFMKTFHILKQTLGEDAFSIHNAKGTPMGQFSALHFEALTLGIQCCLNDINPEDSSLLEKFKDMLIRIKNDEEFKKLTTGGGKNYAAALKQRIEFVEKRVKACLP